MPRNTSLNCLIQNGLPPDTWHMAHGNMVHWWWRDGTGAQGGQLTAAVWKHLGLSLGDHRGHPRRSWSTKGRQGAIWETSLGLSGAIFDPLGAILGPRGAVWGRCSVAKTNVKNQRSNRTLFNGFAPPGAHLEASWPRHWTESNNSSWAPLTLLSLTKCHMRPAALQPEAMTMRMLLFNSAETFAAA